MDELRDSTPLRDDGGRLRGRLAEDGYLFFRRLIEPASVRAVREDVLSALDRAGWLAPGSPATDARPGPAIRREGADDFWDGYRRVQRVERFHRLAHRPEVRAVLRTLLADDVVVHPQKIARASFPRSCFTTPPHQDFRYIQGTTDTFTVWMPLGDCPAELGGLRVLAGSQDNGLLPVGSATGAGGLAVDVRDDHPDWVSTGYEAGDVLVFHSLTVHGAMDNTADRLRLSVDYRYQSAREPIARPSLTPHFFPKVPDWPELAAGWNPTDPPYASPFAGAGSVAVTGFESPAADLTLGPSRFVRVPRGPRGHDGSRMPAEGR